MNADAQLQAMVAELVSAGYDVERDVSGQMLSRDDPGQRSGVGGLQLDLVAKLRYRRDASVDLPSLLVIEVANRRRPADGSTASRPLPRYVEDDEAVRRFKLISEALAEWDDAELQIRFFDVSADQAAARSLTAPIKNSDAMIKRINDDRILLARSAGREDLARALIVARLWAHWLRIVGHRHPGREHRELKTADLRTIQKDLFDQQLINLSPAKYRSIHQALLAAFEGGDLEPSQLLELEPEVRRILDWAAQRYGAPALEAEFASDTVFGRLREEIGQRATGRLRDDLEFQVMVMAIAPNSETFSSALASFLLRMGRNPVVSDTLFTQLLELAANRTN